MSDEEWAFHERFILAVRAPNGRKPTNHRLVLDGIFWIARTGSPWRDLPAQFGPWQTVWKRHRRFSLDGTYDRLLSELQVQADAAGELDWQVSIDSTIARVHQHGATARRSLSKPTSHTGGAVE